MGKRGGKRGGFLPSLRGEGDKHPHHPSRGKKKRENPWPRKRENEGFEPSPSEEEGKTFPFFSGRGKRVLTKGQSFKTLFLPKKKEKGGIHVCHRQEEL